jgi:pantoate kinase
MTQTSGQALSVGQAAYGFAPGNVSCVFKVVPGETPETMHSLGLGFTVDQGVVAEVTGADSSSHAIFFNDTPFQLAPLRALLDRMLSGGDVHVSVRLYTSLPLASGYGLSGASCLAAAHAVNSYAGLEFSDYDLAMLCHVVEVEHLTGLGDVCGQYHGGCLMKLEPGKPLAAERLPLGPLPVYVANFAPLSTAEVLGSPDARSKIEDAGSRAILELRDLVEKAPVCFDDIVDISYQFACRSELIQHPKVIDAIEQVRLAGGKASMIMLGNAVFANVPFKGSSKLSVANHCAQVISRERFLEVCSQLGSSSSS